MAGVSLCQPAPPAPGATPNSSSRRARLVAAWSNSDHVNTLSGESSENSTQAGLSGVDAALRAMHSDRVMSVHQPAARYCAASALVTAAASTPIARSYEISDTPHLHGLRTPQQNRCRTIAGAWLAAAAQGLRERLLQNALRRPRVPATASSSVGARYGPPSKRRRSFGCWVNLRGPGGANRGVDVPFSGAGSP